MSRIISFAVAAAVLGYAGLAQAESNFWPVHHRYNTVQQQQPGVGSTMAPAEAQTAFPYRATMRSSRPAMTNSARQFASENAAHAQCRGDTVVWVNTKSRVYHLAGSKDFGNTKHGAFMCRADADRTGTFRPAKHELTMLRNQPRTTAGYGSSMNRGF